MHLLFDFHTGPHDARPSIHDHNNRTRLSESQRRLLPNFSKELVRFFIIKQQTPRVDHIKNAPAPLRSLINSVARDTDLVDGDGAAAARVAQAVL